MSFGLNLQFLREQAGMTQEGLAEALQVSRQSVSKWESERFLHRYPILVAAPVTAFFLAVLWLLLLGGEAGALLGQSGEVKLVSVFLLVIGVGVTALVWAVLRKGKYDIALWNRRHDPSPEAVAQRKRVGRVCGAIMLAATAVYLALGFGAMAAAGPHGGAWGWQWGCGVYPVAGVLCAMAAHLLPGAEREEP